MMDSTKLLDIAFHQASKEAGATKGKKSVAKERRHIEADLTRVLVSNSVMAGHLKDYLRKSSVKLNDFERELLSTVIDFKRIEDDRKRLENSLKLLEKLTREFEVKIRYADNKTESNRHRGAFYGRASSVVKRIKFDEIEKLDKEMGRLPKIRKMKTVIICGYPNVGKSIILKNLTGHKVEVASYPFTTKNLLIGFLKSDFDEMQLIDTPGILDRPVGKRNPVERRAALALKHLSKSILFVADPSEACGYSLESQNSLLKTIEKEFGPKMMIVSTHADLPQREFRSDININSNDSADIERLRKAVFSFFR